MPKLTALERLAKKEALEEKRKLQAINKANRDEEKHDDEHVEPQLELSEATLLVPGHRFTLAQHVDPHDEHLCAYVRRWAGACVRVHVRAGECVGRWAAEDK